MSAKKSHEARIVDIARRAGEMKSALLTSVVDQATGEFIGDKNVQNERLSKAAKDTIYEGIGTGAATIVATHSKSLQTYCKAHGMPDDEILASCHKAIENTLAFSGNKKEGLQGTVFEGAETSTTEGVLMRDRMVALILPVNLQSITSRMVTHIPADFNQSEMFKVWRVAGSTFGDLTKGDRIDYDYNGRYSVMDQRWQSIDGNAVKTGSSAEFKLDTATVYGTAYPIKRKSVKIMHDHSVVASDDGSGNLYGSFVNAAGTTVSVTGTVNYTTGTVDPVFTVAPALGIEIHIGFDVDIEKEPTLIPRITHEMDSQILYPHESAITADTTVQALWAMRREYNLSSDNMAMQAMRNLLAADKDRKVLRDLEFFAKGSVSWSMDVPDGTYYHEHYETLKEVLLQIDTTLIGRNGISGLVGVVGDPKSVSLFRAMKAPFFVPAAGYRKLAQPHYVGRIFGMWDLYEDPAKADYTCLCFGKGANHGESCYVTGDAIPALSFRHPTMTDLTYRSTLWELAYRDVNPFGGRDYLMNLSLTTGE